jgi:hypothetical protein
VITRDKPRAVPDGGYLDSSVSTPRLTRASAAATLRRSCVHDAGEAHKTPAAVTAKTSESGLEIGRLHARLPPAERPHSAIGVRLKAGTGLLVATPCTRVSTQTSLIAIGSCGKDDLMQTRCLADARFALVREWLVQVVGAHAPVVPAMVPRISDQCFKKSI